MPKTHNQPVELKLSMFGSSDYSGYKFKPYSTFRGITVHGSRVMPYGEDNQFPIQGLNVLTESPTAQSCLNRLIDFCLGQISYDGPQFLSNLRSSLSKCFFDFIVFKSFALRLVRNLDGSHITVNYQPWSQVRLSPDFSTASLSLDWSRSQDVIDLPIFSGDLPLNEEVLFIYQDLNPQEIFYSYQSTSLFRLAQAEASIISYFDSNLSSGFQPQVLLSLPYQPSNWDEFITNLKSSYCGVDNADKLMVVAGDGEQAPTFNSIPTPDLDKYNNIYSKVQDEIITYFGVPRALLGKDTATGFSNKAEQLIAECTVFEKTKAEPFRTHVLDALNSLLGSFGYPKISIDPIDIRTWFEFGYDDESTANAQALDSGSEVQGSTTPNN